MTTQPPSHIHHRRSIRLPGYDYSQEGEYFITICTHIREKLFGEIINEKMIINEFGQIAFDQWNKIPERFSNVELAEFVIMPNHVHGILILHEMDGDENGHPQGVPVRAGFAPAPSPKLGDIVGAYKSLVANECLEIFKSRNQLMGKLWHRNYYEHIIQNDKEYENIAEYIQFNPQNWADKDEYFR